MNYTYAAIIFNPNSTGQSEKLAEKFHKKLATAIPSLKVELIPTEHAGHAETLAYEIAQNHKNPIVISSSGDGGYNEVVNGALRALNEGYTVTTGLLPAGNANDHFHNLHDKDMVERIANNDPLSIDLLKITYKKDKQRHHRYAHSYIGFGISSLVGKELNKTKLNRFNEMWLLAKTVVTSRPVKLKIHSRYEKYDSVIISNVDKMSKMLKVSRPASVDDGLFEVTISRHDTKMKLVGLLVKASLSQLEEDRQTNKFKMRTKYETSAQIDGEIIAISAKSKIVITNEHKKLACFV